MGIFDAMYIFHQNMLGQKESIFSIQIILDVIIIAIIIRFGMHRISSITAPKDTEKNEEKASDAVKVKINPAKDRDNRQEDK